MFKDFGKPMSVVLALAVLATTACSSDKTTDPGIPRNALMVNVVANTSLTAWLTEATTTFNAAARKTSANKSVFVKIQFAEVGQTIADHAKESGFADMWIPDNEAWITLMSERGSTSFGTDCVSVARSPLIVAMWRPLAESLGWPTRKLGWLDISSLTSDEAAWHYYSGGQYGRTLRFAHAHPGLSGSGASTLLAVMQAAKQSPVPLTTEEIKSPIVQASLNAFEGGVAVFGASPNQLAQTMRQRGIQYLGAAAMYENNVLDVSAGNPEIVPIYPFEGTFFATHPACINTTISVDQREASKLFRDFLLEVETLRLAEKHALRPATGTAKLDPPLDTRQPAISFSAPAASAIQTVQSSWKTARKPMHLVLVMDTSGSMKGGKIDGLKRAAKQFVTQMNDNDYLTLLPFNAYPIPAVTTFGRVADTRTQALDEIDALQATGGTALYDAISAAAKGIAAVTSKQRSNLIVVLSDGLDANSTLHFGPTLISKVTDNDTSLYTIAYGADADDSTLTALSTQSNGAFYKGGEADIAAIYQGASVCDTRQLHIAHLLTQYFIHPC